MNKQTLTLILLSWFLGNLSIHFLTPALPQLAIFFSSSPRQTQLVISLFLLGKALGMLIWCALSERIGRKPVFIIGLLLYAVSNFAALATLSLYSLLFWRLLQGLAVGATLLMGRCMINETYSERQATFQFSYLFTAAGLIICFLPFIGAFINANFDWATSFLLMGIYSLSLLIFSGFSETRPVNHPPAKLHQSIILVFHNPAFVGYLMISALMMAGESAFNTSASFILIKGAHFSISDYGQIKTLMALMHLLGTATCGFFIHYFGNKTLVGLGVYLFVMASTCMWFFNLALASIYLGLILPMTIYHFGTGFIVASTAATIVRPFPKQMATALALSLFFQFNFSAGFSLLSSLLAIQTVTPFMLLITSISLLSLACWKFLVVRKSSIPELKNLDKSVI